MSNHRNLCNLIAAEYTGQTDSQSAGLDCEYWVTPFDGRTAIIVRGTEASGFFSQWGWVDTLRDLAAVPY